MVFLTGMFLRRVQEFGRPGGGPDKFWRVQQQLRFSWVCTDFALLSIFSNWGLSVLPTLSLIDMR